MSEYDVAVIGGGPAGTAAVSHLAWRGLRTTIWISESPQVSQLQDLVEVRTGTVAWGVYPGFEIAVRSARGSELIRAKRLILATGSTQLARSFPGSDLPGVMTGEGLLRMLNQHGVWPGGRRVAIVGDDQEMIANLCETIERCDGDLVVVTNDEPVVTALNGVAGSITLADGQTYGTDIVAICAGQQPDIALVLMLECATGYSATLGGFVPVRSADLETTVSGVYVCGSCAGIGCEDAATGEGVIAAEAAARSLHPETAGSATNARFEEIRRTWAIAHADRLEAAATVTEAWRQHRIESVRAAAGANR